MSKWTERMSPILTKIDRDDYSRDRARIIHSAFFRRLQNKTQVLGLGESDFYRTRLTHSVEVAQVASGIVETLKKSSKDAEQIELLPSLELIEAIALAHDIGHPPFGHGGEVALNYSMRGHGGFEGNGQTLRICTKLGEYSDTNGLNLTRRTLLGVLKYPAPYSMVVNEQLYKQEAAPLNIDSYKPPKCTFDCDDEALSFILRPFSAELGTFQSLKEVKDKHRKTRYKALDTTILELADDIAYGVHDLEDAVALNLVTENQWREQVISTLCGLATNSELRDELTTITENLFSGRNKVRKKAISFLVGHFIRNCSLQKQSVFIEPLLDWQVIMNKDVEEELDVLKKFVVDNVVKTVEVQTLEYKGQQMVIRLFEAIANNPSRLLLGGYFEEYKQHGNSLRVICDYIAGTTDDYATRLYHKIFTPSNGSIFDRL